MRKTPALYLAVVLLCACGGERPVAPAESDGKPIALADPIVSTWKLTGTNLVDIFTRNLASYLAEGGVDYDFEGYIARNAEGAALLVEPDGEITINSDGTFSETDTLEFGRWSTTDNRLTFRYSEGELLSIQYRIDGDIMTLSFRKDEFIAAGVVPNIVFSTSSDLSYADDSSVVNFLRDILLDDGDVIEFTYTRVRSA